LSEFFQGNVLSLEFDNQYFMIFLGSLPFEFCLIFCDEVGKGEDVYLCVRDSTKYGLFDDNCRLLIKQFVEALCFCLWQSSVV